MNYNLKDIFEEPMTNSNPRQEYPVGHELDSRGRAVGTGPVRFYKSLLLPVIITLNITLLTVFSGVAFKGVILHSPLFSLLGGITAFVVLVISQVVSLLFWVITGIKGSFDFLSYRLSFGRGAFQSICSLIPFSLVLLYIILKTLKLVHVSEKKAVILLAVNLAAAVFLLFKVLSIFPVIRG